MYSGIHKMWRKYAKCTKIFAQNTKIVLKKGIDNGNKQSDYTIISGRIDSIYALWAVKIM